MFLAVLQSALIFLISWATWGWFKSLLHKDPLAVVPGPPPESWLSGSLMTLLDKDAEEYHEKVARKYGRVFRFTGLFKQSMLYVYDPKALHHIVVKDQHAYEETPDLLAISQKVFGMGLLSTTGDRHRKQRKILNPVFSVAHMRGMVPAFFDIANKTRKAFTLKVENGAKEIDVAAWMARTALELIGQGGYGYSFDSLEEGAKEHRFAATLKGLTGSTVSAPMMIGRIVVLPYVDMIPRRIQRAIVDILPWKAMHVVRDMVDLITETSEEIYEATKRSVMEDDGSRKDIMSVLVKANNAASEGDRISEEELVAQISTLTFAAMDTTSNALARTLYLLSRHPEVQDKLRSELLGAFQDPDDQLDYDALSSLPYLDAVCRETLRVHTPLPYLSRETTTDIVLPLEKPITSTEGKQLDSIFVPKGTRLILGLLKCNTDPDIWGPDAHEWKPERWLSPLPERVADAHVPGIYSHLMTFLGGSRACIGFKFSQLEMKVVLSTLVRSLRFAPSDRKVLWEWNTVVQPTTEDAEILPSGMKKLQLPLKVSLL